MKTFHTADVMALAIAAPDLHRAVVKRGRFSKSRAFVEVPDDISLDGLAEPVTGLRLGDAVAAFAQPVARAIDAVAGTHLVNCRGCQKRKDALNRIGMPAEAVTLEPVAGLTPSAGGS